MMDKEVKHHSVARALRAASVGTWCWDLHTNRYSVDSTLGRLLGLHPGIGSVSRETLLSRVYQDDRTQIEEAFHAVVTHGKSIDVAFRILQPDAPVRWLQVRGGLVREDEEAPRAVTGIMIETTEPQWADADRRRHAGAGCEPEHPGPRDAARSFQRADRSQDWTEAEWRKCSAELHAARQTVSTLTIELGRVQAREREHLAGLLHDHLVQLLVVMKLKLDMETAVSQPSQAPFLQEIVTLVDEALNYTRTVMLDLHPPLAGNEDDLPNAMAWVKARAERHGLHVTLVDHSARVLLNDDVVTFAYQAVHELLFNVLKHAQTARAEVHLRQSHSHVEITVMDEGVGFEPSRLAAPSLQGSFGLANLQHRARGLGGSLYIFSSPGKGTCVLLRLPLEAVGEASRSAASVMRRS